LMASFPCLVFLLPFFSLVWADINPSQEADSNPSQEADINPSQEADSNPSQQADSNPSQEADINPSQERFLNISFVPPSPNLLAAVGACQGGRCPGLTGGAISSPNFPLNYPDKASVTYQLETYRDSRIRLQFEVFDLEESANCRADYLTLHSIHCGKELPGPFTSEGNTMVIRFHSDYLVNRQGFLATWTEVKPPGLIERRTQGEFKTPNYPNKYPRHTRIRQIIAIPDGAKVEFKVLDFKTNDRFDHFCINSQNWRSPYPDPDSQCYSGTVSSIPTFEKDPKLRYLTLSFRSGGPSQSRGINIQWKIV